MLENSSAFPVLKIKHYCDLDVEILLYYKAHSLNVYVYVFVCLCVGMREGGPLVLKAKSLLAS